MHRFSLWRKMWYLVGAVGGGWSLERDSVHELVIVFQKCCTHLTKCTSLQILQKPVAKPAHGVLECLPTNKDTNG